MTGDFSDIVVIRVCVTPTLFRGERKKRSLYILLSHLSIPY